MAVKPFESLAPTETLEIENELKLVPRVRLNFIVYPSTPSVTKPLDEWKLKRALIDYLQTSLSVPINVIEEDIAIKRVKDIKKRKREDPLAHGVLFLRDLGFLESNGRRNEEEEEDVKCLEKKFLDWRKYFVDKLDGIELNLEGSKFRLTVSVPEFDDFEGMKKAWEDFYSFGNRGFSRSVRREPDSIVLRGVPSRWFSEPRVSSKPSMLVTHTIFSTFGRIRNLNIAEDDGLGKDADGDGTEIISGLHCKITVQFEKYRDFYNALKVLCGRSLKKQGSRLCADYEVTWNREGFFQYSRNQPPEKANRMQENAERQYRSEAPRYQYNSRSSPDDVRRRRFKE